MDHIAGGIACRHYVLGLFGVPRAVHSKAEHELDYRILKKEITRNVFTMGMQSCKMLCTGLIGNL